MHFAIVNIGSGQVVNVIIAENESDVSRGDEFTVIAAHRGVYVGAIYDFDVRDFLNVEKPVDDELPVIAQVDFSPPEIPPVIPPTVNAIAFMRLFTSDERIKARELRATDPKIDDFWRQLEDPRTDVVVMALPSIQDDIECTLNAINTAGLTIDVQTRKAEILSGQVF
ncbi:MAG: hypothetical protein LV471_09155 [Nitrosomonas sp.]|nr:hypothetical protein [Nitrosomonas sp.]